MAFVLERNRTNLQNQTLAMSEPFSLFSSEEINKLIPSPARKLKKNPTASSLNSNSGNSPQPPRKDSQPKSSSSGSGMMMDFDAMLNSQGTKKLTSTPDYLKSIESESKEIKLQTKGPVAYESSLDAEVPDEDDKLFGIAPKKKELSMAEFLKNSGPEDPNPRSPKEARSLTRKPPPPRPDVTDRSQFKNNPLMVDSDDEDAELFGMKPKKKEESMSEFLKNTGSPEPRITESPAPKKKNGFTSLFKADRKQSTSLTSLNSTRDSLKNSHKSISLAPSDPSTHNSNSSINIGNERSNESARTNESTRSTDVGPSLPRKESAREPVSPRTSSHPGHSPRSQPSYTESIPPVPVIKRKQRPAPKTIVPEKFDDSAPLKKVFKNLTRIDTQFLNVFEAKIDVRDSSPFNYLGCFSAG